VGQNDDARQVGEHDLATHDAQIKHSRAVDRTTTRDRSVSTTLPPTDAQIKHSRNCGQNDDARQVGEHDLATHDAQIKHSRTVDRTTTRDRSVSTTLPPTTRNQTLTSCGQNDDARQVGEHDLATHDAQIKHSRTVDRTTTRDRSVSTTLPPTTRKSNTHSLWTERRREDRSVSTILPPTTRKSNTHIL